MITKKLNKRKKKPIIKQKQKFRLQTKEIFLTYSQSGALELEFLIDNLKEKLNTWTVKHYVLVKELHEDGNPHIHVYLKTIRMVHIASVSYMDLELTGKTLHPNIQPARKVTNVLQYMLKFVQSKTDENLLFSESMSSRIDDNAEFMPLAKAAMALARKGQLQEALNLYENERPDFFIQNHLSLEKSLRGLFLKAHGAVAKFDFSKFSIPESLSELLGKVETGFQTRSPKSLYLHGGAGTGKSRLIESFVIQKMKLKPLVVNNFDAIKEFKQGVHTAIVFDDIDLKKLSEEELIKLLDSEQETTFRVTYGNAFIPAYTLRFFISNKELKDCVSFPLTEAMTRRVMVFALGETKMFSI
jgi:hypothetical protein